MKPTRSACQFIGGPWSALLPVWAQWAPITQREVGYHPPKRRRQRDRFTEEEVHILRESAAVDPFDHALFTFFLHSDRSIELCNDHPMDAHRLSQRGSVQPTC